MTRNAPDDHPRNTSPDHPLPDPPDQVGSAEDQGSVSPATAAHPGERGEGANEEMLDDGLFRADEDPPGAN